MTIASPIKCTTPAPAVMRARPNAFSTPEVTDIERHVPVISRCVLRARSWVLPRRCGGGRSHALLTHVFFVPSAEVQIFETIALEVSEGMTRA
jgi:hypothetical protein